MNETRYWLFIPNYITRRANPKLIFLKKTSLKPVSHFIHRDQAYIKSILTLYKLYLNFKKHRVCIALI